MKHPDPEYRQVGEMKSFGCKFLLGKIALFIISLIALIFSFQLVHIGRPGAWVFAIFLLVAIVGFIALFRWNFWPSKLCPSCHSPMEKTYIHPADLCPPSEQAMILSCPRCKTYIDLGVSTE